MGFFRCRRSDPLGAAGVPFGAAEIEEREVDILLGHRVRVDPQRQLRVAVAQLRCDPADALPGRERETRIGVASVRRDVSTYAPLPAS